MMETKSEKSARRRLEALNEFDTQFAFLCDEENKNTNITPGEKFHNAIVKMEQYIQGKVKVRPQEKSFIQSISFEWQRLKLEQLEEIKKARKRKEAIK